MNKSSRIFDDLHGSFRAAASSSAAADDDEGLDVNEPDTDAKPE